MWPPINLKEQMMTEDNGFDFEAFMAKAANPEHGSDIAMEQMMTDVSDQLDETTSYVVPRIAAVMRRATLQKPNDLAYQNAVLNAAIYGLTAWVASCVPKTPEADALAASLPDMIAENMRRALEHRSVETAEAMFNVSMSGERMLMEDACKGMADILQFNTNVIQQLMDGDRKA